MNAALPDVRRQLAGARDEQMARVVALVDALPQRGAADALIAPLRPRMALAPPPRPMNAMRLMFRPLDPVITPGPRWRPGMPAVPRTVLGCLGAAVLPRLGAAGPAAEAALSAIPPGASPDVLRDALAQAGAALWPAAAAVLDGMGPPPDWSDASGLPPACFAQVAAGIAAVLHQATRLAWLDAGQDNPPSAAAAVGAILADAQTRPSGLPVLLAVLLAHGPAAALLAGGLPNAGALPPAVLDKAVEGSLDRAGHLLESVLPVAGLQAAANHAGNIAALLEAVDSPASRPALRAHAARTRQAADQACRDRLAGAAQRDLASRLAGAGPDAPVDDAAVEGLEAAARDLRRLGRAGRRLGQPFAYDALMVRLAREAGALSAPGLTRMDRLRLAELLVGADAALRLVPEGDPS